MQAERDHLVRFVFPRLREQLLPHHIHLVDVDLRWGVTSEQDALEVCREIIDECRPRFLCILGGRYGWVPPGKDRSITADEVHYGVLDRTLTERGFAYFYFRAEAATAEMLETTSGEFREPEGSDNQNKLARLKHAIIAAGLNPFTYPAQWDNESSRLTGLIRFGERVYDDLLGSMKSDPALCARFVPDSVALADEFTEENAAIEAFVEERSERFVLGSRAPVLAGLLTHAIGDNGYLCLTGAPGSGKSALLAHLSRHPTLNEQSSMLLIRHFVGASPDSTDVQRTLRRLCYELKAGCADINADIPDDPEELHVAFSDFLRQVAAKRRVVLLLDAIDQFDPASHSTGLHWLPQDLPADTRIILSALDGPLLEELRRRLKPREIALQPLTAADGAALIEQFGQRFHKQFEPEQRAALLAKTDADTPLYVLAALEELRTLGTYDEITRRIVELPPTTRELFAWLFERLENDDGFRAASGRRVGRELVSRFAALLAASRFGLSQHELAELLDAGDPQGNVAALLHLLRPYLMRRGELLDFYHAQFRAAARQMHLQTEEQRRAAHARLAAYFNYTEEAGQLPSQHETNKRMLDELPWQLERAGDYDGLSRCLTNIPFFMQLLVRHEADATRYFRALKKRIPLEDKFSEALETDVTASTQSEEQGYRHLIVGRFFEMQGLLTSAEKFVRRALAIDESRFGPDHKYVVRDLTTLALLMQRKGRATEAEQHFLRVLQILSETSSANPADISSALQNLALHYFCVGRYAEAETYYRRALEIATASLKPNDPCLPPILFNLAGCLNALNRPLEAEPFERQAIILGEQIWGDTHPLTALYLAQLASSLITRRPVEAEQLARRAEKVYANYFGADDVRLAGPLTVIAQIRQLSYRLPEAEELLRRVLELEANQEELDQARVAFALENLAGVIQRQGRPQEAAQLLRRAIQLWTSALSSDHPKVRSCTAALAEIEAATRKQKPRWRFWRNGSAAH